VENVGSYKAQERYGSGANLIMEIWIAGLAEQERFIVSG
jgi:hypothetical protein